MTRETDLSGVSVYPSSLATVEDYKGGYRSASKMKTKDLRQICTQNTDVRVHCALYIVSPGIDPGYSHLPQSKILMCNLLAYCYRVKKLRNF
jgi:hypothetical protein